MCIRDRARGCSLLSLYWQSTSWLAVGRHSSCFSAFIFSSQCDVQFISSTHCKLGLPPWVLPLIFFLLFSSPAYCVGVYILLTCLVSSTYYLLTVLPVTCNFAFHIIESKRERKLSLIHISWQSILSMVIEETQIYGRN